jgi:hypothetical protein
MNVLAHESKKSCNTRAEEEEEEEEEEEVSKQVIEITTGCKGKLLTSNIPHTKCGTSPSQ